MSEIIESGDELVDETADAIEDVGDEVGMTSEEAEAGKKESLVKSMTVFDVMLLLSLIFITLATLNLFLELNTFGRFPGGFPWRTTEF